MKPTIRCSHAAAGLAVMLALSGSDCRPWSPASRVERQPGPGLVQTVTLEPSEPRSGESVRIESVVTNRSSRPIGDTFLICQLGFAGDLALSSGAMPRCAAVSFSRVLAPGESVTYTEWMVVESPPGEYELEVKHTVHAPSTSVTVRVVE